MKPRPTLLGTITSFNTTRAGYTLGIQKPNGLEVTRFLDPEVAHRLAAQYGVRARSGGTSSMQALKGAACRYRETSQGLVVEVEVLPA
jgi:hypothetical protein